MSRRRKPRHPLTDEHRALMLRNYPLILKFASDKRARAKRWGVELEDFIADLTLAVYERLGDFDPARGRIATFMWMVMDCRLKLYGSQRLTDKRQVLDHSAAMPARAEKLFGKTHAPLALVDVRDQLASRWHKLDARERRVLHARFWQELKLSDVAGELGVSKERVRQIQNEAIEKLRGAA